MRQLTLEEASKVTSAARTEAARPEFFNAQSSQDEVISTEFESYLILTPISTRNSVSTFFSTILESDPNQIDLRNKLLSEYIDIEKSNEQALKSASEQLTSYYDQVHTSFTNSVEGFEDVTEAVLVQEALTSSMGNIVSSRDRHVFNYAVLSVLSARLDAGNDTSLRKELQSWVRVLVEYD